MEFLNFLGLPDMDVLSGIMDLHRHVFEGAELTLEKLMEQENLLIVVAKDGEKIVGFKIGYEFNTYTFYSWLGGVHADYRGKGVASQLMQLQHELVKLQGFTKIRTISRNKRREMLLLNIKFGFDIIETFTSKKGTHKIVLEKEF